MTQAKNKKEYLRWIVVYSAVFLLADGLLFWIFAGYGKSFLWNPDGIYQHYVAFNYLCEYLSNCFKGGTDTAFFNYTIGQGADVLTTLNSYDFLDPISVLSALLFPLSRYTRYVVMIFAKLYISGLSIFAYCKAIDVKNAKAVLVGAISYAFSTNVIFMFARHPNFANWCYFFPLLIAGVEVYRRKGIKLPIILLVTINIITNYYTFYMNAIQLAIYVAVISSCAISERGKGYIGEEFRFIGRLAASVLVGVFLSFFILLPTIYAFLNNTRLMERTGYMASLLVFPRDFYPSLIANIFTPFTDPGYLSYIGLNAAVAVPLLLFLFKMKGQGWLKILLLICSLMMCIPFFGSALNGFGYVTNRWIYSFIFYVSIACVIYLSIDEKVKSKAAIDVYLMLVVYAFFCVLYFLSRKNYVNSIAIITMLLLAGIVDAFLIFKPRLACSAILTTMIIGACLQICLVFAPEGRNYVDQFLNIDDIETAFTEWSSSAAPKDDGFYRIETEENRTNVDGIIHTYGTSEWWSVIPSYVAKFYTDLDLNTVVQNCYINGFGGRSGLMSLAGVRYYTRPISYSNLRPLGFHQIESKKIEYQVFENDNALPIAYGFSDYITEDEYNNLNGVEKEEALLQAVVVKKSLPAFNRANLDFQSYKLDFDITEKEKVLWEGDEITAKEKGAFLTLSVEAPPQAEMVLCIKGAELQPDRTSTGVVVKRTDGISSIKKTSVLSNNGFAWPVKRDCVAFDLGSGGSGHSEIKISFESPCTIQTDGIEIIAMPADSYIKRTNVLKTNGISNVTVTRDKVSGLTYFSENKILQFAIPYSDGWSAYIDGEKTEIIQSDKMYMSVLMPKGAHKVELHYRTPGLIEGIIVSLLTIIGIVIYLNKKRIIALAEGR